MSMDEQRSDPQHEFFAEIYEELREVARKKLSAERANHTLQPTALVHEVYLRLAGLNPAACRDRVHFFRTAAKALQHVLVDHGRRRSAEKRSAQRTVPLVDSPGVDAEVALEEAVQVADLLEQLEEHRAIGAEIVRLRYFGGMSHPEIAAALAVTENVTHYEWALARKWLKSRCER